MYIKLNTGLFKLQELSTSHAYIINSSIIVRLSLINYERNALRIYDEIIKLVIPCRKKTGFVMILLTNAFSSLVNVALIKHLLHNCFRNAKTNIKFLFLIAPKSYASAAPIDHR